jgi:hypothetical protein
MSWLLSRCRNRVSFADNAPQRQPQLISVAHFLYRVRLLQRFGATTTFNAKIAKGAKVPIV